MADEVAATPVALQARLEYGDACSEVLRVHDAVGVWPVAQGTLRLTGQDRVDFMQNISSNDVRALQPGEGCMTLLLTPKGKIQFPLTVLVGRDHLDLVADISLIPALQQMIESSLIMEDVTVENRCASCLFMHLAGKALPDLLSAVMGMPRQASETPALGASEALTRECSWKEHGGWTLISARRTPFLGVDLVIPAESASAEFERMSAASAGLGGGPVGTIAQDILRTEAALPKFGVDYTNDHFPQEAALEESAVSFTKGCYTGQEVVARIKTYGGVNRRLVGLVIDGPAPAPGEKLFKDGKEAGHITSAARSIKLSKVVAIAMAAKSAVAPQTRLRVSSPDGPEAAVYDIAAPEKFLK